MRPGVAGRATGRAPWVPTVSTVRLRPVGLVVLAAFALLLMPVDSRASAGGGTGRLDSAFGQGGKVVVAPPAGAGEWPGGQAVQPDGSIVVAGTAAPARNGYVFLVLRFLPDGRPDPSFGTGGGCGPISSPWPRPWEGR